MKNYMQHWGCPCWYPQLLLQPNVEPKTCRSWLHETRDCTEDVHRITTFAQLRDYYGDIGLVTMSKSLRRQSIGLTAGIKVYAVPHVTLNGQRGIYYTDNNSLFMNDKYGLAPESFLETFRHEVSAMLTRLYGWHS